MCLVSHHKFSHRKVTDLTPESVPYVDRAFVHIDYTDYNLPTHMSQQD